MNNGKEFRLAGRPPFDDPTFWALLRSEPARTLEILRRHLGPKRAINAEMEQLCWKLLAEHCGADNLGHTVIQRLRPGNSERLLDLEDGDRELLYRHFEAAAAARLDHRGLGQAERERIRLQVRILAEVAFEAEGEMAAAAAFYALAHDRQVADGSSSRAEREELRQKLEQALAGLGHPGSL